MSKIKLTFVLLSFSFSLVWGQEDKPINDNLKNLLPFVGKTWRGEFINSTPEKPMIDISQWEFALNGQAVRIIHSVNDGEYGGETIIVWDNQKQNLIYYYFTTAGFYTNGTISFQDGKFISHEFVTGNSNGISEVKSTAEINPDGKLHSKSEYFQNGNWVDGHEITYTEDPHAVVKFK
jgi:hypothetical protein